MAKKFNYSDLVFKQQLENEFNCDVVQEYKFHPVRRWRFDFALPKYKIAIEQEGAVWTNGRHTRGSGFVKDMEKYNSATELGWRILRYTPKQILEINTLNQIKNLIELLSNGKEEENL